MDDRFNRALAAHWVSYPQNNFFYSPTVMTESSAGSARYHEGDINWSTSQTQQYYKTNLVEPELSRPPQADVTAAMWRIGNRMHFEIKVTNHSGVTLYAPSNGAAVTGVVYEDIDLSLQMTSTSRLAVGEGTQPINPPLADGASAIFSIETNDLGTTSPVHTVNWGKVHGVAFVDYRPAGAPGGTYDMLQAAMATPPFSTHSPSGDVTSWYPPITPGLDSKTITFEGLPANMTWTATKTQPWLTLSSSSGTMPSTITATFNGAGLLERTYQDTIHVTAAGPTGPVSEDIPVSLIVSETRMFFYLPSIWR